MKISPDMCAREDCNGPDCEGCRQFNPYQKGKYRVKVRYEVTRTYEVEAASEDEACDLALDDPDCAAVTETDENWDDEEVYAIELIAPPPPDPSPPQQKEKLPGMESVK